MTSYKGMIFAWKRLSGAVMTGRIVGEDKRFLFVKSDKVTSDRDYDFTIVKRQVEEMPHLFTFTTPDNEGE